MEKKSEESTLHHRLEQIIKEMVDKELHFKDALGEFEKIYIESARKKYRGNKTKMAKALGLHRNTLHNRTKKLNIRIKK